VQAEKGHFICKFVKKGSTCPICPPVPTFMPLPNVRSALYVDLPYDKIYNLSLLKSNIQDNLKTSFAGIFATKFFTFRIIGILLTSFYNIHGMKAVRTLRG